MDSENRYSKDYLYTYLHNNNIYIDTWTKNIYI